MEKSVVKAIDLVEALARMDAPAGVTSLAQELKLTKSNVFRLLDTLVRRGYVRRHEDTGQYELTLKVWHLGLAVLSRMDLKKIASPYIHDLMRSTKESVHLSVIAEGDVIYIDKVESDQPVRAYSRIGDRPPAHCVATGKALLAYLPFDAQDKVLKGPLEKYTPNTITSARALRKELETIRRMGYSVNRGEWRESVCGIAAPIRDASGEVVAAVGISGPAERFKPDVFPRVAPRVILCANQISAELGNIGDGKASSAGSASKKNASQRTETVAR